MAKPPRRFYTSDQHIGHKFVSEIRGFSSVQEHDEVLAEHWDATVRPNDIVYVLGDIAINPRRDNPFEWFQARPGIKHLVMGNHDPVHPLFGSKALKEQQRPEWLETFATMNQFLRVSVNGIKFMVSHFPYRGEGSRELPERYSEFRLPDRGLPLLHGHTHSHRVVTRAPEDVKWNRQIHVGVDAWNFTPVSDAEIWATYDGITAGWDQMREGQ